MLQSANCKKQMERRTRVRRKSVTQSFTRCGAEFLRYCFGLAINYTRAIPIFQFTNSLTALLKVTQKVSAIVIKSKGNAKRALPTSHSSMSGSSVRPHRPAGPHAASVRLPHKNSLTSPVKSRILNNAQPGR